jgi:hypothetical protein
MCGSTKVSWVLSDALSLKQKVARPGWRYMKDVITHARAA